MGNQTSSPARDVLERAVYNATVSDRFGFNRQLSALSAAEGKLLLAVSGGADSMALLLLAHASGRQAEVATLDHGLRPEARSEVEFVRAVANRLGLPFHTASFDTRRVAAERGWNLEETARTLRYQHLAGIARRNSAEHIVTAHTLDDQSETVLMQLLRGAAWLTGIPPRTGRVVRPLLHVRRAGLVAYLQEHGQTWHDDETNLDTMLQRAWLRHDILPLLRARHPDLDDQLHGHVQLQRLHKDFTQSEARRFVDEAGVITAQRLRDRHPALQFTAVAHLLRAHGVSISMERLQRVSEALADGTDWRESLSPELQLRLQAGRLTVVPRQTEAPVTAQPVTSVAELPEGVLPAALELPGLTFRSRQPGDRIRLPGGTRKVADVLIDAKLPREERGAVRLLASGNTVIWIEGIAVAADFADGTRAPSEANWMRQALELAREAAAAGELPVGAVIVRDGAVIASSRNSTEADSDPTAHAELRAIRQAATRLGDWRLNGCTLYVTLEPCLMCFGAMQQAHLSRVVYAARNLREGAAGGVADVDLLPWKRSVTVEQGPFAREAAELLSGFFRQRRGNGPDVD